MPAADTFTYCKTNSTSIIKNPSSLCSTVQETSDNSDPEQGLVTFDQRKMVEFVLFAIVIAVSSVFGMLTNLVNCIVFYKQGFNDTVNIGLFALAIADFFTLLTLEWVAFCFNPAFTESGVPWDTRQVLYLTGSWPHFCFGRISVWVTTYITAERCLCIAIPMKVKQIITPRRTTIVMVITFVMNFMVLVPIYMASYLDYKWIPEKNVTLVTVIFRENGQLLDLIGFFLFAAAGAIPFPPVIIFTIILVVRLKRQSNWRMKSSHDSKQQEAASKRDSKTMNMLVMVACILIVCYTPGIITSVAVFITPEFSLTGREVNLFYVMWTLCTLFQVVNSSVNIFVYYRMSTKYKKTFRSTILRLPDNQNE